MDENDIAIKVENVSKDFLLPHEKNSSLKSAAINIFKSKDRRVERQHALRDISFEVKKGEFFGIVGRNGSGKSTLLKILAGIYQPTKGKVQIDGRLVPFIELGVGFNPELSGKENVYLNGALLGFSRKEIAAKYKDIVEFAELEKFMDQKLKNYSSGMQVRLAFSVATVLAESDVLLIDEVLAVGDADFQKKCYDYFKSIKKQQKTVIFVSHNMDAVREYCDRAVLINDSVIEKIGSTEEIAALYTRLFNAKKNSVSYDKSPERWGNGDIKIMGRSDIKISDEKLSIEFCIESKIQTSVNVGFSLENQQGQVVVGTNTQINQIECLVPAGKSTVCISFANILSSGDYSLSLALQAMDGLTIFDWWSGCAKLSILNKTNSPYAVSPACEFKIK